MRGHNERDSRCSWETRVNNSRGELRMNCAHTAEVLHMEVRTARYHSFLGRECGRGERQSSIVTGGLVRGCAAANRPSSNRSRSALRARLRLCDNHLQPIFSAAKNLF
jgi:hypothetical protein